METAEIKVTQELKVLIAGTDGVVRLKDKHDKEHVLPPLDFADMLEFERKIGGTLLDEKRTMKLADVLFLLYLSLRKTGCTDDEINRGQYKMNERQVYMLFDLRYLNKSGELFTDMMKMSGVVFPPPEANPAKANPGSLA